jgi:hypothetical protein
MRLKLYTVCLLVVTIQKAVSVTLSGPQAGTTLTTGISFQVAWDWDGLPNPSDDGAMDILLATDISASTVVAQLDSNFELRRLSLSTLQVESITSNSK